MHDLRVGTDVIKLIPGFMKIWSLVVEELYANKDASVAMTSLRHPRDLQRQHR
jgi:hypothetical protein